MNQQMKNNFGVLKKTSNTISQDSLLYPSQDCYSQSLFETFEDNFPSQRYIFNDQIERNKNQTEFNNLEQSRLNLEQQKDIVMNKQRRDLMQPQYFEKPHQIASYQQNQPNKNSLLTHGINSQGSNFGIANNGVHLNNYASAAPKDRQMANSSNFSSSSSIGPLGVNALMDASSQQRRDVSVGDVRKSLLAILSVIKSLPEKIKNVDSQAISDSNSEMRNLLISLSDHLKTMVKVVQQQFEKIQDSNTNEAKKYQNLLSELQLSFTCSLEKINTNSSQFWSEQCSQFLENTGADKLGPIISDMKRLSEEIQNNLQLISASNNEIITQFSIESDKLMTKFTSLETSVNQIKYDFTRQMQDILHEFKQLREEIFSNLQKDADKQEVTKSSSVPLGIKRSQFPTKSPVAKITPNVRQKQTLKSELFERKNGNMLPPKVPTVYNSDERASEDIFETVNKSSNSRLNTSSNIGSSCKSTRSCANYRVVTNKKVPDIENRKPEISRNTQKNRVVCNRNLSGLNRNFRNVQRRETDSSNWVLVERTTEIKEQRQVLKNKKDGSKISEKKTFTSHFTSDEEVDIFSSQTLHKSDIDSPVMKLNRVTAVRAIRTQEIGLQSGRGNYKKMRTD